MTYLMGFRPWCKPHMLCNPVARCDTQRLDSQEILNVDIICMLVFWLHYVYERKTFLGLIIISIDARAKGQMSRTFQRFYSLRKRNALTVRLTFVQFTPAAFFIDIAVNLSRQLFCQHGAISCVTQVAFMIHES